MPERLLWALRLRPFYRIRSERQLAERIEFDPLLPWLAGLGAAQILLADRAYSSDALRAEIAESCTRTNIKLIPNRLNIPAFSPWLYPYRNLVERLFNKLKHFSAIATRLEKHDATTSPSSSSQRPESG